MTIMKVSLVSLAALLGVATGFSAAPSNVVNTRSVATTSLTSVQLSSTQVDAAPFAKPPR